MPDNNSSDKNNNNNGDGDDDDGDKCINNAQQFHKWDQWLDRSA